MVSAASVAADLWRTCPGQIQPPERAWLKEAAERAQHYHGPGCVIVNVGVFRGASMWCLRAGAPEAQLVGLDIDLDREIVERDALNARWIEADSQTYDWQDGPIHLLFIDTLHYYDAARRDIEAWVPHVAERGMVAFHDYRVTLGHAMMNPQVGGVRAAVDEWFRWRRREWTEVGAPGSIAAFVQLTEEWK